MNSTNSFSESIINIIGEQANRVHFWLFDGWEIPVERSVVTEVYPALRSLFLAREGSSGDQHNAYSAAAWMRQFDRDGSLTEFFNPSLTQTERSTARIEGWILGIK